MKFSKYIIVLFVIPLFAFSLHKYYISLCEIEYIKEEKSVQITIGLFLDDLEYSMNKGLNDKLYLASEDEVENIDDYYKKYLSKHFKVTVNDSLQTYTYVGKEYDDDIVRFYLEFPNISEFKSISITNTCLVEDFPSQQNIIKIKVDHFYKTFYLNNKNANCLLNF